MSIEMCSKCHLPKIPPCPEAHFDVCYCEPTTPQPEGGDEKCRHTNPDASVNLADVQTVASPAPEVTNGALYNHITKLWKMYGESSRQWEVAGNNEQKFYRAGMSNACLEILDYMERNQIDRKLAERIVDRVVVMRHGAEQIATLITSHFQKEREHIATLEDALREATTPIDTARSMLRSIQLEGKSGWSNSNAMVTSIDNLERVQTRIQSALTSRPPASSSPAEISPPAPPDLPAH